MNAIHTKSDNEAASDIEALRADISALKKDLTVALAHLKSGAVNGARNATAHIADSASGLSESLVAQGERAAKSVGDHIEQQPFTSVLVAFSAGLLLSRFLSR